MANNCTWDPSKHGGKPCPIHGSGMWDENILTKQDKVNKLKEKGYTEEEIEEELKNVGFDDDFDLEEDDRQEIIDWGKENWVKTPEDEKAWNSLSNDEKYLLAMSGDMGFWFDEIQGIEENEELYNNLASKFSISKNKENQKQEENNNAFNKGNEADDLEDKVYDFDKWAKENNTDKRNHAGYLDINSSYDAGSILNYISNDPDWSISDNGGNTYLLKHKSGPVYSYNKDTQQISLTTEKAEQEKGKQAHTKELTNYIQDQIKKGATDPEAIYQNSPYSIHSHDEMVNIANNLLKGFNNETIDYENVSYPKGTSKEFSMMINNKYQKALPILEKAGIKLSDFGGKNSAEGGYEDNSREIMEKYVFEPFREKYPQGNNEAWQKEYQPLYDAIEVVLDKNYNDWYIKNKQEKKQDIRFEKGDTREEHEEKRKKILGF